jgi:hypothetical protein
LADVTSNPSPSTTTAANEPRKRIKSVHQSLTSTSKNPSPITSPLPKSGPTSPVIINTTVLSREAEIDKNGDSIDGKKDVERDEEEEDEDEGEEEEESGDPMAAITDNHMTTMSDNECKSSQI